MADQDNQPGNTGADGQEPPGNNNNNDSNNENLLSGRMFDKQDIMELFKIGARTVYEWRTSNELPFIKVGGKYFYPEKLLEKKLNEKRKGNGKG